MTRAPDRCDQRGEGSSVRRLARRRTPTHMLSFEPNASLFWAPDPVSWQSSSAVYEPFGTAAEPRAVGLGPTVINSSILGSGTFAGVASRGPHPTDHRIVNHRPRRPFTAKTVVRFPLGAPRKSKTYEIFRPACPISGQYISAHFCGQRWTRADESSPLFDPLPQTKRPPRRRVGRFRAFRASLVCCILETIERRSFIAPQPDRLSRLGGRGVPLSATAFFCRVSREPGVHRIACHPILAGAIASAFSSFSGRRSPPCHF